MENHALFEPLTLPNGAVLPNRLCKAAMEENLADPGQVPGQALYNLYHAWAAGGAGLILTGNVMIAPDALTGPGGVVLQDDSAIDRFALWATVGRSGGGHIWMQINHPGRQVFAAMGEQALSASDVPVDLGKYSNLLGQPRAMTESEILETIGRFANTASLAERAGFTGVQIHAAHGYLLSQFLSPLTNKRDDAWGGDRERRAKMLFETVKAVRAKVAPGFCVSVKLNSADFQKGGFDVDDAKWVVGQLSGMGVDLIELSGGSYESPAMQGRIDEGSSSHRREAYFIDFARDIATAATMPVMVTGGIKRASVAVDALADKGANFGVSVLGIATAMAYVPDLPNQWRNGQRADIALPSVQWKNQTMASMATMALTKAQLKRLAAGKSPKPNISPLLATIRDRMHISKLTKRYRKWREAA